VHSASFITCFSVGALHSSEIHRVRSSALSLLSRCRVGLRGDLAANVATFAVRWRSLSENWKSSCKEGKQHAAPTDPRAIKHIHEILGWEFSLRFRQTAGCPGQTLRAYFRRRRAVSPPRFVSLLVSLSRHPRLWYHVNPLRDPFNSRISRRPPRACRNNV